ncbi:MAG: FAD:protein FMN transferase [Haliscomenobacter sp.]|nr:FAD:protein FMN transferase [Haliscomenobacter sp.]
MAANSEETAALAETQALAEIDRLEHILSGYASDSEFSQWARTNKFWIYVSSDLFEVLRLFDFWKQQTGGAIDPAAEAVSRLWKKSALEQRLPTAQERAIAVTEVHQTHWTLDERYQTAIHLSATPLMTNTFVKSYIIRKVAEKVMALPGVESVVVNIGGDILASGARTEMVAISNPFADAENDAPLATVEIRNKAIATSGNYRRGFSIQGKWYSHIVDPRTAFPVREVVSATVVAPNATDAGALATAFNVLSPEESKKLAATLPGVEYLIVGKDGRQYASPGWEALLVKKEPASPAAAPFGKTKAQGWSQNYELLVTLELSQFEGRFRRPFVAVWVENSKSKPCAPWPCGTTGLAGCPTSNPGTTKTSPATPTARAPIFPASAALRDRPENTLSNGTAKTTSVSR